MSYRIYRAGMMCGCEYYLQHYIYRCQIDGHVIFMSENRGITWVTEHSCTAREAREFKCCTPRMLVDRKRKGEWQKIDNVKTWKYMNCTTTYYMIIIIYFLSLLDSFTLRWWYIVYVLQHHWLFAIITPVLPEIVPPNIVRTKYLFSSQ